MNELTLEQRLGDRAPELKHAGARVHLYGIPASEMSRDELLMALGLTTETQVFQGGQLARASQTIHDLSQALAAKELPICP